MEFHEKSLELNITHELLNLADSWYWFLVDTPLWRYWRPRYKLPFYKAPKSTSGGFHITTEGKDDPTGEKGGGYDVRIKTGLGNHLLFIQYKKGELETNSPSTESEFNKHPYDHYKFEINGTTTNQHFVLRNLANGIGATKGNAVIYALPLIADMNELEANAGKLIRKTKFISILDIDLQAEKNEVEFEKGKKHNFRVGKFDMKRCEVNFFFFFFNGKDRTPEIIADIITLKFEKTLKHFLKEIEINYKNYNLFSNYIAEGIYQAYVQYKRYLLHYFEVSPEKIELVDNEFYDLKEFENYENNEHDINILESVFNMLLPYEYFLLNLSIHPESVFNSVIPSFEPKFLIRFENEEGINIKFQENISDLGDLVYMSF